MIEKFVTINPAINKAVNIPEELHFQLKMRAIIEGTTMAKLISDMYYKFVLDSPAEWDVIISWTTMDLDEIPAKYKWLENNNGVYMYVGKTQYGDAKALYVGHTQKNFYTRIMQHKTDEYAEKSIGIAFGVIQHSLQNTDILFRQVEDFLIDKYNPQYNIKKQNTYTRYEHIFIRERFLD